MCRLLKVSKSGFYDWQDRPMSAHERRDVELAALVHTVYERSHRTYGARRVHVEFREGYGVRVGRKRVARLMRTAGLKGVQKKRFWCTTRSGATERWAPDLVERQFVADRPDALWVADVTYVPTAEGFLYLAIVLDVFSRLIVGWAMAARLSSHLVQAALDMAYAQRTPQEVIHHSDHGSEPWLNWPSQHCLGFWSVTFYGCSPQFSLTRMRQKAELDSQCSARSNSRGVPDSRFRSVGG
jgi:transposase InsO family protein